MRLIIKVKYNNRRLSDKFVGLRLKNRPNIIAFENAILEILIMMCANKNIWTCYSIIASMTVSYEDQIMITSLDSGMYYWISQIPLKKYKNFFQIWLKKTYGNICIKIVLQDMVEWVEKNSLKRLDYVYLIKNFAWKSIFVNIYENIILNILYWYLKRMIRDIYIL